MLPSIAAEYERRVQEARDRLADSTQRDLSKAEQHRLAAKLYGDLLRINELSRPLEVAEQRQALQTQRGFLEQRTAAYGRRDYSTVRQIVRGVIEREGLPIPEDSPSRDELERLTLLAAMEVHRQTIAKLEGAPAPTIAQPELAAIVESAGARKSTVRDLLDSYEAAKGDAWSASSKAAFAPVRRLLEDTLGDREVASLTREDARAVQGWVKRLPRNLGKLEALAGLPIPKAVEKAERLELPLINPKTMNSGYLVHVMALFNWADREGWAQGNAFRGLSVADKVDDADRRDPFTAPQLNALFQAAPWQGPAPVDIKAPGRFWVPLLGLFQGARRGELAGLQVRDVEEIDGTLALNIRDNALRPLKNKASRRVIPVHPELLAMGFGAYVKHRRDSSPADAMLFPDLKAKDRGQYGYNLGVWFGRRVRELGLQGTSLSLHSLRHNFQDALRRAGLHGTPLGLALAGRDEGGSAAGYGYGYTMAEVLAGLSRVEFPGLDLKHLQAGGDC